MKRTRFCLAKSSIAGLLILLMSAQLVTAAPPQEPQGQSQAQSQRDAIPDAPTPQPAGPQSQSQQQNTNPVGTAAAPVAKPTGVAASRPAGAAIAPAKQKRRKAILIRVGIIVGAGIAVGTVAALSRSSSGRP